MNGLREPAVSAARGKSPPFEDLPQIVSSRDHSKPVFSNSLSVMPCLVSSVARSNDEAVSFFMGEKCPFLASRLPRLALVAEEARSSSLEMRGLSGWWGGVYRNVLSLWASGRVVWVKGAIKGSRGLACQPHREPRRRKRVECGATRRHRCCSPFATWRFGKSSSCWCCAFGHMTSRSSRSWCCGTSSRSCGAERLGPSSGPSTGSS